MPPGREWNHVDGSARETRASCGRSVAGLQLRPVDQGNQSSRVHPAAFHSLLRRWELPCRPPPRPRALWEKLQALFVEERRKGVLDISLIPSSITAHEAGFIDRANEVIVG